MKFGIGQPVRRKEDIRFITGRGRYTDDIALPGQACAVFSRSPHAHARVRAIDTAAAKAMPGVLGVLTQADMNAMGADGTFPFFFPLKNRDGSNGKTSPKPILVADKVRHVGEAVAVVVAETAAQAQDAAEAVTVDYAPLPAVANALAAANGPLVWDHAPNNLCFDWETGNAAEVDAAFAKAAHKVAVDVVQNRVVANAMEPRAANGTYDPATDTYTLYTSTQGASMLHHAIAGAIMKIPDEKLRIVTPDVGGGFGMKGGAYPEQAAVLLAARAFGRPVKWTGERTEGFLSDTQGRDARTHAELALDKDGHILAVRVKGIADVGAYLSPIGPYVPTNAGLTILGGIYDVPLAYAEVKVFYTNTVPISAYRGAGRPEAAYLMDRLIDKAAKALGIDRIEIRRRNLVRQFPYKNWGGMPIDSGEPVRNLEDAARAADWAGFDKRKKESAARGKLRGIGVCYYMEIAGGPPLPEPSTIKFTDNGAVEVYLGTQSNGQGHETAFAQVLSERLGVPFESIAIKQGDSSYNTSGLGTVGSRTLQTSGNAIVGTADKIIEKGKRAAGQVLQAGGVEVNFAVVEGVGKFRVAGTEREIAVGELAMTLKREKIPGFGEGLDSQATYAGPTSFPNGCHIAEVEVDPDTGKLAVLNYTVVDDLGRIVNPLLAAGQVHGGVAQGLGQALMENCVYDADSGQLMTASFQDYALPRADDMPPLTVAFNEIPCTTNPMGSKGAGEAGTIGALAALVGAVSDALGIEHIDMPTTAEKVWRAAQAARAARH
jgi:aerobic carbon-monoxide dehydrogenase large subunit